MLGGDDLTARERIKVAITQSIVALAFLGIMLLIAWITA